MTTFVESRVADGGSWWSCAVTPTWQSPGGSRQPAK